MIRNDCPERHRLQVCLNGSVLEPTDSVHEKGNTGASKSSSKTAAIDQIQSTHKAH